MTAGSFFAVLFGGAVLALGCGSDGELLGEHGAGTAGAGGARAGNGGSSSAGRGGTASAAGGDGASGHGGNGTGASGKGGGGENATGGTGAGGAGASAGASASGGSSVGGSGGGMNTGGGGGAAGHGAGGAGASGGMSTGGASGGQSSGGNGGANGGSANGGAGGAAGSAGSAGSGVGTVCGGITGVTCPADEWCHYADGNCGAGDQTGKCASIGGAGACLEKATCGCDGKAYVDACRAFSAGIDTSSSNSCITGVSGGACFVDTDCTPGQSLQCCGSPLGILTCTQTTGSCPLTP
jgi:hypothetical protein